MTLLPVSSIHAALVSMPLGGGGALDGEGGVWPKWPASLLDDDDDDDDEPKNDDDDDDDDGAEVRIFLWMAICDEAGDAPGPPPTVSPSSSGKGRAPFFIGIANPMVAFAFGLDFSFDALLGADSSDCCFGFFVTFFMRSSSRFIPCCFSLKDCKKKKRKDFEQQKQEEGGRDADGRG